MGFPWFGIAGSPQKQQREDSPVMVEHDDNPSSSLGPGFRMVKTSINSHCKGCVALVTGSSGLCGARLVEMLLERGASSVVAFDLASPDAVLLERFDAVQQRTGGSIYVCAGRVDGDITNAAAVERAFTKLLPEKQIDVVFHIAALVGPFYDFDQYMAVNFHGTQTILEMCHKYNVPRLVYSSSPSTRFTGADVTGETEDQLPMPRKWLAMYAQTKAYGEQAVTAACGTVGADGQTPLYSISVAPHQIYGPHDHLFLTKILETAGNGRLRIFGKGLNKISVCFVDNYCHGLLCGADVLQPNNPALGRFYIVTDGEPQYFWRMINEAAVTMGFTDLNTKLHLPVWLLYSIAYLCDCITALTGKKFKLTVFNVRMMTIHRYFSIENAIRDLQYQPVIPYSTAWPMTLEWFRTNWLPNFLANQGKPSELTTATVASKKD
jgi:nucleoside-diphosphate-sugar epimerase